MSFGEPLEVGTWCHYEGAYYDQDEIDSERGHYGYPCPPSDEDYTDVHVPAAVVLVDKVGRHEKVGPR